MNARTHLCGALLAIAAATATASDGVTNPALTEPDRFAWQLFTEISRPAANGTNDVLWETWIDQRTVYGNPNATPVWPAPAHREKVLERSIQKELLRNEAAPRDEALRKLLLGTGNKPALVPEFLPDAPLSQETRLNQAAFDFVVANRLWYLQGQIKRFQDGRPVSFPPEARETKAEWKEIAAADKTHYHWQTGADGKTYGLTALHITSKDIPNWFWATFEHVDNARRCLDVPCRDTFGLDAQGQVSDALKQMLAAGGVADVWQQYRLTGTQVDFVDSTGRPTILGNSIIEGSFMTSSSCITCHARATVNAAGRRLAVFDEDGNSHNGAPDPSWFWTTSSGGVRPAFQQLDFVWSFLLARPRTVPE